MNDTAPDRRSLPKVLWIGTVFFVLAGAAALLLMLRNGEQNAEAESTAKIEGQSVTLNAEQLKRLRREAVSETSRRRGR